MQRKAVTLFTSLFLIAGCGGGGGGGGGVTGPVASPGPTVAITSNNAMDVALVSYSVALDSSEFADLSGTGLFIGGTSGGSSKLDGAIAESAKLGGNGNQSQVPIPAQTQACEVAGDVTISGEIADPITPTLTAGDFFEIDYNNCNDGLGDVTDGLMRMDVDAFTGDLTSEAFDLTATLTMELLQVTAGQDTVTSDGDVTATIDTTNPLSLFTGISGQSMTLDTNQSAEVMTNFTSSMTVDASQQIPTYMRSSSGTLDSTQLSGVIRYSTPVTFQGLGSDFPNAGEFLVQGAASSLRLIAENNTDVSIEIDTDGDGNVDQTIQTTWAELMAQGAGST
jgi:hypothetical protein